VVTWRCCAAQQADAGHSKLHALHRLDEFDRSGERLGIAVNALNLT